MSLPHEMPTRYALSHLIAEGPVQGQNWLRTHAIDEVVRHPRLVQCNLGNLNLVASRILGGHLLHCRIGAADLLGSTFENTVLVQVTFSSLRASGLVFENCFFESVHFDLLESMSGASQIHFEGAYFRLQTAASLKQLAAMGATFNACVWESAESAELPAGIRALKLLEPPRATPKPKVTQPTSSAPTAPVAAPAPHAPEAPKAATAVPNRFDTIEWKKEGTP